jgi:hypothetical protein
MMTTAPTHALPKAPAPPPVKSSGLFWVVVIAVVTLGALAAAGLIYSGLP